MALAVNNSSGGSSTFWVVSMVGLRLTLGAAATLSVADTKTDTLTAATETGQREPTQNVDEPR
jgi:hypothetical protein